MLFNILIIKQLDMDLRNIYCKFIIPFNWIKSPCVHLYKEHIIYLSYEFEDTTVEPAAKTTFLKQTPVSNAHLYQVPLQYIRVYFTGLQRLHVYIDQDLSGPMLVSVNRFHWNCISERSTHNKPPKA